MILIIKGIPETVTKTELQDFISGTLGYTLRLRSADRPRICSCDILFSHNGKGSLQHNGIVAITPDKAAKKALSKLQGTRLKGKRVEVEKYTNYFSAPTGNFY